MPTEQEPTDLAVWTEFLARFGLVPEIGARPDGCMTLTLERGMPRVGGYYGFITEVKFDQEGQFVEIGAYE